MTQKSEPASQRGVLTPSVPWDIGRRSQRQRILAAMAASCAEKSYALTTIADIVSGASISRATFYKHFENKQACFAAAAEGFVDDLRDAALAERRPQQPLAESLSDMIGAVLERLVAKPALAKLLLIEAPYVDLEIVQSSRDLVVGALSAEAGPARGSADPEIAFGRAKLLIADYLAADKADQLPSLLPELLYIALLPYRGQEAALHEAGFGR
jgi:AcrR family transcriptional regulator